MTAVFVFDRGEVRIDLARPDGRIGEGQRDIFASRRGRFAQSVFRVTVRLVRDVQYVERTRTLYCIVYTCRFETLTKPAYVYTYTILDS